MPASFLLRCPASKVTTAQPFPYRLICKDWSLLNKKGAGTRSVAAYWAKGRMSSCVKYWEIIADKLSKAGWSWGCVSAVTSEGQGTLLICFKPPNIS